MINIDISIYIGYNGIIEGGYKMAVKEKEKFSTQVDPALLKEVRSLAEAEGRQTQFLVEEALKDLLEKRRKQKPRDFVMQAHLESQERYKSLYEKLAGFEKEMEAATDVMEEYRNALDDLSKL
jgi:predicted transcriptional regulator